MKGQVTCRMHGGASPKAKAKAAERLVEAKANTLLASYNIEPVSDPIPVLQAIAGEVLAFLTIAREQVAKLTRVDATSADGVEHLKAAITLYERGLDRAHKVATDLAKLGLSERQVELDEKTARLLLDMLDRLSHDQELALTPAQRVVFWSGVQRARVGQETEALN